MNSSHANVIHEP